MLIFLAMAFLPSPASAGAPDRIRYDNVIHIAWRADAPPFFLQERPMANPPVSWPISAAAVVRRLAQQLNLPSLQTSYVTVTAVDRFEAIQQNKVDLLCEPIQQHSVAPQVRGFPGNDVR